MNRFLVFAGICSVLLVIGFWLYQTQAQEVEQGERVLEVEIGLDDEAKKELNVTTDVGITAPIGKFLVKYKTSLGPTDDMFYDKATGNIGIGTMRPSNKLHINMSNEGELIFADSGGVSANIYNPNGFLILNSGGSGVTLHDTTGEVVRVESGNVGIGTTEPEAKLEISKNILGEYTALRLTNSRTGANDNVALELLAANIGLGDVKYPAKIVAIAPGGNDQDLAFYVTNSYTQFVLMYLDGDGNVGIGTTSPTEMLHVAGNVLADQYLTPSSKRWKTNIKSIAGALDKVQHLRGVSYNWKADGKHDIGLIAEEVGEVIPEVVVYEEDGQDAKSVDYARLVAVLIEATKEQQQQIEQLQTDNEALKIKTAEFEQVKAELKNLKANMAQLESALHKIGTLTAAQANGDAIVIKAQTK